MFAIVAAAWRWLGFESQVDALHAGSPIEVIAGEPTYIIGSEHVQLFSAGLRAPAVFASEAALRVMDSRQLRAAVLHERSHIAHNDTRFRPVLSGLRSAFGWLPPIRDAVSDAVLVEEIRADRAAIRAGASAPDLIEAILAVNGSKAPASSGLGDGHVATRLNALAGHRPTSLTPTAWRTFLAASVILLGAPIAAHVPLMMGL
jgi:beta-lactamase regulating signal transducer with metallopeptidase domain